MGHRCGRIWKTYCPDLTKLPTEEVMDVGKVADAVVYMAGLPPDANIQFMTIMATKMPFVGRG